VSVETDQVGKTRHQRGLQTIPRQHGAWSVLLLSTALGVLVAGRFTGASLLLLVGLLAVMPARHTAGLWLRARRDDPRRRVLAIWVAGYALVAGAAGLALVVGLRLWWLVPIGALAGTAGAVMTLLERSGRDRTLGGEVLGMVGLSLAIPAAYTVSLGSADGCMVFLWLLGAMAFATSVLHVRHVLGRLGTLPSVGGHAAAVLVAAVGGALGLLPQLAFVALLPALARAAWPVLRPPQGRPAVRRLGFEELGYGIVFVLLAAATYRF
jgi:hypothetical protein